MKEFFLRASLTSSVAILTVLLGFGLLYMVIWQGKLLESETRVQILAIAPQLIAYPLAFLFTASKNRQTQANTNNGDVNVTRSSDTETPNG